MKYYLLGSIVGDICGSRFEWDKAEDISPEFKFITKTSRYTDDTVLTMAVAESLIKDRPFGMMIKKFAKRYPDKGYGGMFKKWMNAPGDGEPYNSFGNGSAMRLLAVPLFYNDLPTVLRQTMLQSACTHNHPEAIDACMLLAHTIFLARTVKNKSDIYKVINKTYGYEAKIPGDTETRKRSLRAYPGVYEALNVFFHTEDFTTALRCAIKHGGDTDTVAAICCGLSYVFYEKMPIDIVEKCLILLPEEFRKIIKKFATLTEENYVKKSININSKKLF